MRLNNKLRRTMVHRIMADVPKVQHTAELEKRMKDLFVAYLPPDVQKVAKGEQRVHLHTSVVHGPATSNRNGRLFTVPGRWLRQDEERVQQENPETWEYLRGLEEEQEQSEIRRRKVQDELWTLLQGCRTTQQVARMAPELAEYLPEGEGEADQLPASQVVNHLQAAGWPKGGK